MLMKRELTKFIVPLLEIAGTEIYPHKWLKKICARIVILFVMICGFLTIILFTSKIADNSQDTIMGICYIFMALIGITSYFSFYFKTNEIRELLQSMDDNVFTYADETRIEPNYNYTSKEKNMVFIGKLLGYYMIFNISAVIFVSVMYYLFNDNATLMLYPGVLPWDSKAATFIFHLFVCFTNGFCYYLRWIYLLLLNFEIERQCKRLQTALATIEERSKNKCGRAECGKSFFQIDSLHGKLVECVRHHQKLRRLFTLFKSWFNMIFSIQLACQTGMLTLCMYLFFEELSIRYKIHQYLLLVIIMLEIFILSYIGNQCSEINEKIRDCLFYDISWYEYPPKTKKLVITFQSLVQCESLTLTGFSIVEAGYYTFGGILRKAYSYFNILRSVF